jgi:hypothetical protein
MTAVPGSHDGDVGLPDYVGGWMAHGHPDYHGYAWYRRTLMVPDGRASWDILAPTLVEDGYELYWNGQRLGGSGRLGANPRVVGTRPLRFELPADAAGTRGVLAVRVYMRPGSGPAQTAAACTARRYSLRGRSPMRSTACNGIEPSPATSWM